jgi:alkanesulfonate monooxygenase SsuD/methylene tetrahydromethanopterin reductase-like flavin-dependent oxidoreductase (luciferase family)
VEAGRRAEDVRIFAGITVVVDRTEKAAREKYEDYVRHASPEAGLAHFSAGTGIDFSQYDLDEPITYGKGNFVQTSVDLARERGWTKRTILSGMALGGRYPLVVGDANQVADALEAWIDAGEVDGFNLARTVTPESYEDFIDLVVPVLQERGRYKTAYGADSLRNRLFGGGDRLPDHHPAGAFRTRAAS